MCIYCCGCKAKDVHALNCEAGCRCANSQDFPSCRSQSSQPDDSEVEQELRDDRSVRQIYNSEMVDDVDAADARYQRS